MAALKNLKPRLDFSLEAGYASLDEGDAFGHFYGALHPRLAAGPNLAGTLVLDWPFANQTARGVLAEPMCGKGLRVVRRVRDDGWDYFVVNRSGGRIDDFVELARPFASAVLLDPAAARRKGLAELRGRALRLVMDPGESVVIRCFNKAVNDKPFSYQVPDGEALVLGGAWSVRFIEGGPELPADYESDALASWTLRDDPKLKAFSGTARYALPFDLPEVPAGGVMLDLGVVAETCRVTVNGRALGSSFFPPHRFDVSGALKAGENQLEVEVPILASSLPSPVMATLMQSNA